GCDSLGWESALLYPALTTAATAPVLLPRGRASPRDRSPSHRPPARLQTLAEPPARTALPVRAHLLRIRHAGHRPPRRPARKLAGGAAHRPLPSPAPGRPRPGPARLPLLGTVHVRHPDRQRPPGQRRA